MKIDTSKMTVETDLELPVVYTVDGGILDEVEVYTELPEAIERAEQVFRITDKAEFRLAAVQVVAVYGMVVLEPGATYYELSVMWVKVTPLMRPERVVRDNRRVNHYSIDVDPAEKALPLEKRGYSPAPGERKVIVAIVRQFGTQFIPEPEYFGDDLHTAEEVFATIPVKRIYHEARRNYQREMASLEEDYGRANR